MQLGERRKVFGVDTDFKTLQEVNEFVKGEFDLPNSKQICLQRFDNDWNEYIDINHIQDIEHKDKLLVVVLKDEREAKQETMKVFRGFYIKLYTGMVFNLKLL